MSSNLTRSELPALVCLKKSMYNVVNTLAPSFLIGSSSFLQVTRTTIKSWMSLTMDAELAALDQLKHSFNYLRTIQNYLMTCWLSGERSLPFGLLVISITLGSIHIHLVILIGKVTQQYVH